MTGQRRASLSLTHTTSDQRYVVLKVVGRARPRRAVEYSFCAHGISRLGRSLSLPPCHALFSQRRVNGASTISGIYFGTCARTQSPAL
jgi:hypothetical protein